MAINMSYCRWQNTLQALQECYESTYEDFDPRSRLSDEEKKAFDALVKLCRRIADDFEG